MEKRILKDYICNSCNILIPDRENKPTCYCGSKDVKKDFKECVDYGTHQIVLG